ncbi:MAG TPA: NUDIX domain-containing protein [Micromonosporaceae bacterium]
MTTGDLVSVITGYRPATDEEAADLTRIRALVGDGGDPWHRSTPLHVTASALIVHPPTGRVLLRWHARVQAWIQVGGHGDPGEVDPLAVAMREAVEETGLTDLVPWPDAELVHVVIVPVPTSPTEPAHEHADLRYLLATEHPDAAVPESPDAPLRWLTVDRAVEYTAQPNLRETLRRVGQRLTRAA